MWVGFEEGDSDYPVCTGATWDALEDTGDVTLQSVGTVTITAPFVTIGTPTVTISGVLDAASLVTGSVVASPYTNSTGNIW